MNRREKIIVGVMIFAIGVGGIYFMTGGSGGGAGDPGDDLETLNRFVVDVAKTINQKDNKVAEYVLEKASAGWQRDPFLGQEAAGGAVPGKKTGAKKTADANSREFSCKGYIVAGTKRLVVINGLAYESGDLIEPEGYRIGAITDKQVVIEKRSGEIIVLHLDDKL
jgi:hypothetical protein